jgi:hypothetical protein
MSQPASRRAVASGAVVHGRAGGRVALDPIHAGANTVRVSAFTPRADDHLTGRDDADDQGGVELDLVAAIALIDELGRVLGPLAATTTAEQLQADAAERLRDQQPSQPAAAGDPAPAPSTATGTSGRLVRFPTRCGG